MKVLEILRPLELPKIGSFRPGDEKKLQEKATEVQLHQCEGHGLITLDRSKPKTARRAATPAATAPKPPKPEK
jgi:hypothetical protein